jgi:magnesium chelatase family protein
LEQLRQVLEEKTILISRIKESQKYPADFLLLAACNPCPCGYLGDQEINCRCSQMQIERYLGKLSGPLLDRIDIHLRLTRLQPETLKLLGKDNINSYNSKTMLEKINQAKDFSAKTKQSLELKDTAEVFMEKAIYNLKLSARSHTKIIKLARTIANLEKSIEIKENHLTEALQYRSIDWTCYR